MMLHFLRHAQAEPAHPTQQDRNRVLTSEGREMIQRASRGFFKMGLKFDQIISSPYLRTLETAKIVAETYQYSKSIQLSDNLVPDALFHKFRKELLDSWNQFKSILIVTHQPFVSECIACLLTGNEAPLAVDMGTATLCSLESDSLLRGPAMLSSMLKADQAALIGEQLSLTKKT